MRAELSRKAQTEIQESIDNEREAYALLELINAEFCSDPQSVQCFDLRIVQRVKACVETHNRLIRNNPLFRD